MADELVLCVEAADVAALFRERGAAPPWLPAEAVPDLGGWLADRAEFRRRSRLEGDPAWRQVCTYAILWTRDGRYLAYRRGESGGEGRLYRRLSMGIGGHVSLDDLGRHRLPCRLDAAMVAYAADRELEEEVHVVAGGIGEEHLAGLIADDSDPVGCVHLGCVFVRPVAEGFVSPREGCLEDPRWMTPGELRAARPELESWSRIVLDRLIGPAVPGEARP